MRVERLSLKEGAEAARGIAVVIDVFRAFTCEPLMRYYGAERIVLEGDIETCLSWRDKGVVLVGERDEVPIEDFDLTNSPYLIAQKGEAFFRGKTVIHRTTSGVTGALAALERADDVLLASFATARATARWILDQRPEVVSVVAMGIRSTAKAPEDEACGDCIESLLTGAPYDHVRAVHDILAHETAQKFLRGDKPYLPKEDPAICLQRDLFDFALRAQRQDGWVEAVAVRPR